MRQRDDYLFAEALYHMARGTMTQEHINLFKSRTFVELPEEIKALNPIHFFWRNTSLDNHNNEILASLPGPLHISKCHNSVHGSGSRLAKDGILKAAQKLPQNKTQGLSILVPLKSGAKYVLTT